MYEWKRVRACPMRKIGRKNLPLPTVPPFMCSPPATASTARTVLCSLTTFFDTLRITLTVAFPHTFLFCMSLLCVCVYAGMHARHIHTLAQFAAFGKGITGDNKYCPRSGREEEGAVPCTLRRCFRRGT
eukprot:Sspe_Gene.48402::Locus_25170_Transcript_1_1_Confidence_1.000_Length_487::g.48402::m.48402